MPVAAVNWQGDVLLMLLRKRRLAINRLKTSGQMNEWILYESLNRPVTLAWPRDPDEPTVQNPHDHHLTTKNLKILFRICNRHASTIHSRSRGCDPLLRMQMERKLHSRKHFSKSFSTYGGCSTCHCHYLMGIRCMVKCHQVTCRRSFVTALGFWHSVVINSHFISRPGRANIRSSQTPLSEDSCFCRNFPVSQE